MYIYMKINVFKSLYTTSNAKIIKIDRPTIPDGLFLLFK